MGAFGATSVSLRWPLGATLEALWGHFCYIRVPLCNFTITLGSLWSHFGCIKVDFQKRFIFPTDVNVFVKYMGLVWGRFGVTLGQLLVFENNSGAFRGHFEVTLSISTSNFMCDACPMHICTGLVGPKTGKVKKLCVFKAFLKGSNEPRGI